MEEYNIFEKLNKCRNYDYAFLTTFTFDIGFFERSVLNILLGNDIRKVSLFVDQNGLYEALQNTDNSSIGKRYVVNPIEMDYTFHPKVILLLGPAGAVLFVSSANLTTSGYYLNNEIFNQFYYDKDNPENLSIINTAYNFFKALNIYSYGLDESLFEECDQLPYIGKTSSSDAPIFINNINQSIISQISLLVKDVSQIDIAVPYYDNDLAALSSLKKLYPSANITLYIQNYNCRINPNALFAKMGDIDIFLFNDFKKNGTKNFYHGKVFRFITDTGSFILYGSANCTGAALLRSFEENGNIECDILEKGDQETFDDFFDNFVFDDREMDCQPLQFNSEARSNYHYKYGIIRDDVILYVGFSNSRKINSIICNGIELKWKYNNQLIEAVLPIEAAYELNDIFTIEITDEKEKTELRCWVINPITLEINRNKELKGEIYKVNLSSEDRFLEDRINIINTLSIGIAEAQKRQEIYDIVVPPKTEEPDEDTEGIISYVIPEANVLEQYKKYEFVRSLHSGFISRYLGSFSSNHTDDHSESSASNHTNIQRIGRKATDQEKGFSSFTKSKIRIMNNPKYYEMVSYEHYLNSINVFVDIFDKYLLQENVQDMFDLQYVAVSKMSLIKNLLTKERTAKDVDEDRAVILLGIESIVEFIIAAVLDSAKEDATDYQDAEWIIGELEDRYKIREECHKYYELIIAKIEKYYPKARMTCPFQRIEQLFGYKTMDQLLAAIKKDYGEKSIIEHDDDYIMIQTKTDSIKEFFTVKGYSYDEIRRYYRKFGKFRHIEVIIENTKEYNKGDPAKFVVLKADVAEGKGTRVIERKSGNKDAVEKLDLSYWNNNL